MYTKFIFSEIENNLKLICIEKMLNNSKNNSKNNKQLMIVPEQNTLSTDELLITSDENNAFLFSNILSFKRLAYYVLNETSVDSKDNINGIGQILLIKKILIELKDELRFYKNTINRSGFATQISETLDQMQRYAFSVNDLKNVLDIFTKDENSTAFIYKLNDLYLIYSKFEEKIKEKFLTNDDLLILLKSNIKNSQYIKDLDIYITSFYSFSVLENRVILELSKYAKSLTIAIPMNNGVSLEDVRNKNIEVYDLYREPKEAVKSIVKLIDNVENSKIEIEHIECVLKNPAIEFLKKNINNTTAKYRGDTDVIEFYEADNKYTETEFVVKYINNLILEGYRYKEIVLVCPDFENYNYILKSVFNKYNIPIFYDKKDFLYKNRIIECIRSAFEAVNRNMEYEYVFRFLKSGVADINYGQIDYLDNYIIEYGIRGYMWAYDIWNFGSNRDETLYDLEELNNLKNKITYFLEPLKDIIGTVKVHCKNLYEFIERLKIFEYIENKVLDENIPINVKREYELVWDKLILIIEQMYDILGDEEISFEDFTKIFDAGVNDDDFGHIPTYDDQIVIANTNRSKIENTKVMIFMDATDKNYPKYSEQNVIFDTEECEKILNTGFRFLDDSMERFYAQNMALFLNILKAEEKIVFIKPKATLKGEINNNSKMIEKIMHMFSKDFLEIKESKYKNKSSYELKKEISKYKDNQTVYKWYKDKQGRLEKELFYNIENEDYFKHKLSKEVVDKLYGNELFVSVSKLEKYVQCPYSYFLRYNVKAYPKKEYRTTAVDYGQLFHLMFELFTDYMHTNGKNYEDVVKNEIDEFVDEHMEYCIVNINKDILLKDTRYRVYLARIKKIAKVSIWAIVYHIKNGFFDKILSEASFKNKGDFNIMKVKLDNNVKLSLTGKIDRVDFMKTLEINEDGNAVKSAYVKIIDYKSSKKSLELDQLYHGLQLQLVLYLDTMIKNKTTIVDELGVDEVYEAGVFYFSTKNPIIEKGKYDLSDENLETKVLEEFKMKGVFNSKDEVVYGIDKKFKGLLNSSNEELSSTNKKSLIYNAELIKGNKLGKKSSGISQENIAKLREFANYKVKKISTDILKGDIDVKPTKFGDVEYCTYCEYKNICQIELKSNYNKFRKLDKISKELVIDKIKDELKKDE